jgi:hypothetical protein
MPLSENHNLQVNHVGGSMAAIASAGDIYVPVPYKGRVIGGGCGISAAVTGAPIVVTVSKVNPAGVTPIGTITIPVTGSGPGSQYGMVLTGSEAACSVEAYESLKFSSAGGTGGGVGNFVAHIRGG